MKISKISFLLLFFISALSSQNKNISLEQIFEDQFKAKGLDALHSMANGQQYVVLNDESGEYTIDVYDYNTLEKTKTLLSSEMFDEILEISDYKFSHDESKLLIETEKESIFRRSKSGVYYVFDIIKEQLSKLSDNRVLEPSFSPDGSMVAYAYMNNLYVKDLDSGTSRQITIDGKKNEIINGIADWVYEEEFGFVQAYQWNSASDKIGFIRFDETEVPEFSMDKYGTDLYQTQDVFKYPKAGETNSIVSLHVYDLKENSVSEIKFNKAYTDFYIPRIKWTKDSNLLTAQILNRHQNNLDLWLIDCSKQTEKLIFTEKDDAYIDITDNLTFLDDNSFIWTSEKDGYNHIYHYGLDGSLINQITKGKWEVTNYYGYDAKNNKVYYQSVENGSTNRDVYSIDTNGKNKKRLSSAEGTNSADFSADFTYYINTFSNINTPPQYTLNLASSGEILKVIEDNKSLKVKLADYTLSNKEFSTIEINGNELNMSIIKPTDFDPSKSYPLLMFQYSGPGSQQVSNKWYSSRDLWHLMLAEKGYIIATVDGRGTGYKGADFKKMTQLQLGKYEVEDQIEAARKLGELPYIDKDRIGIWGWSYGGFMSANSLFKGNEVFKMAIAVAPVTSWRFYDTVYTERYMATPQENPSGYDDNSPLSHVDKLKGDFLLIHGSADDNVHVQNSMRLIEALIQADKDFDWLIYPDKNHGIRGGNTSLHLYRKMTEFIDERLGDKIDKPKDIKKNETKIKG